MRRQKTRFPQFFTDLQEYCPDEVAKIDESDGENAVIYGIPCFKIEKGYPYEGFIFLSDILSDYIGFSNKYYDTVEKLSIKNINKITFKSNTDNLKGYQKRSPDEVFFQILIGQKFYDFCMYNKFQLLLIIKGILSIFQKKKIVYDDKSMDGQLTQMVNKYDTNFDKTFDCDEFQRFAKSLGIEPKLLMIDIDANHDGVITQEEVLNYVKTKTNGAELIKIFNRYASRVKDGSFNITPKGIQKFFHEIQEEPISDLESYQIIIHNISGLDSQIKRKINKKIQNSYIRNDYKINEKEIERIVKKVEKKYQTKEINIQMDLREFNTLLNSMALSVYRFDKLREEVDMDRPLTDYFINSTHNTYITGHQLTGDSSIKMYSLSLLEGYRLVELDCYNGNGDDIIITHGYTLVSKLLLDEILHELKANAFTNSTMPVILSIENHLDEYHQNIMAKKFKEILVDLYIFPYDSKPDHLPTLRELQKKFIIKCGGKRLWPNDTIKRVDTKPKALLRAKKENAKLKKYVILDKFINVVDSDEEENSQKRRKSSLINEEKNEVALQKLYENNTEMYKPQDLQSNFKKIRELYSKSKIMMFKKKDDDEDEEKEAVTIPNLEKVRGMPGVKFNFNQIAQNNYKPWECVTLKCTKFLKYHLHPIQQNEMLKLSQHCLLKAYPTSFNSDNYDIIKCWRCGCQAAALNIQALEDDFTLFNKIFFYQNRKCGFVLKPNKLLDPISKTDNNKSYYSLKMKIISVYNLLKLIESSEDAVYEKKKCYMEIYSLGSEGDDDNPHHKYELSCGLVFPVIMNNRYGFEIPIYEDELGGIMIKFTYDGKLIGRGCIPYCLMRNGYRKIPIFDNDCYINEGVFVLGFLQKKKK
jgi:hypothetical protein